MPGTYSKVYIQIIFAVKYREPLVAAEWQEELNKYISGIIHGKNQLSIIVNGMPDHIHILVGLRPVMAISDLVRDIKNNSSNFINDRKFIKKKFSWQEGYGVFSYAHSEIGRVYNYIQNQKEHHAKKTFDNEYINFLREFDVDYDHRFLFDNTTPSGLNE